jgi:hypothetical protein
MSVQSVIATSTVINLDDGVVLLFTFLPEGTPPTGDWVQTGFPHRPFSAAETQTSGTPPAGWGPVTYSMSSDLASWVDTVKYVYRNGKPCLITYDDATSNSYTYPDGEVVQVQQLYAVVG